MPTFSHRSSVTRRQFLSTTATGAAVLLGAPAVATARKGTEVTRIGDGDYRFEVDHDWLQLPSQYHWQTTHNVAVDRNNFVYVIHEGREPLAEHPSIFVFDAEGNFVRAFGEQFQGGGHGLEVRDEGNESFLYVCAYQQCKTFAKLTLAGEVVWQQRAPMESGVYAEGEAENPQRIWGRDRFLPTNFAFLDDGGFLLADGYGSYTIHRYDRQGQWQSAFGGPGEGNGTFNTPHGIWIDQRGGREPQVVVCDRAHHTLQYLTLAGEHVATLEGFGLPANVDTWEDLLVVPELIGCVSLLDAENRVVARLGDDAERIRGDQRHAIRRDPAAWRAGQFVHPHDACFDREGNLIVAEWVETGRVSKLKRLS